MAVTINDVAKEAGVSITTVSRVINGNYPVSKETRERVEAAIKKLNFQPNPIARSLVSKNKKYRCDCTKYNKHVFYRNC